MEITARITIGPSVYTHHVEKKVVIEVADTDVTDAQQMKRHLKTAEDNLKKLVRDFDCDAAAKSIMLKQERARIKKEVEDELKVEDSSKWELKNKIAEMEKELKKRDCRMDGIIASRNPDYIPPNEEGEPIQLGE